MCLYIGKSPSSQRNGSVATSSGSPESSPWPCYCRPICLPCMSLMCLLSAYLSAVYVSYVSALYVCLIPASAGPLQLTHAPRHTNLGSTRVWAVCTYLHIYMHVYILIYRYRYIDRYIYNIFTHVHAYIHTYICMYVDIYMYIDAYLHTYIHVYIHTFVCMNPYRCTNSGCQPTSVIRTWRTTGPVRTQPDRSPSRPYPSGVYERLTI